jgi:hypothetical protein
MPQTGLLIALQREAPMEVRFRSSSINCLLVAAALFDAGCKRHDAASGLAAPAPAQRQKPERSPDKLLDAMEAFKNRKRYLVLAPDILSSIRDRDLEQALIDHIVDVKIGSDQKHDSQIIGSLSPGFRMMFTTWELEGEVNNGGFNQYFFNSSGRFAGEALAGYRLIGAREHAKLTEQAIVTFEREKPTHQRFKKEGSIEAFSESYKHTGLNDIDSRFYKIAEDASKLRIGYIRAHAEQFVSQP